MYLREDLKHHSLSEINVRLAGRILLLPSLLLAVYIILRAAWLSFTLDESTSWLLYASPPGFFPRNPDLNLANHHLLNSWLMKCCGALFGSSEFSLRLPNVIGGIIYISVAALFARKLPVLKGVLLFIVLTCHPYLLQYFSMARGYGLAAAALLSGLYFAWLYWQEGNSTRHLVFSIACLSLAVLSNLATVDFVLPFFGIQFVFLLAHPSAPLRSRQRSYLQPSIAACGIVVIVLLAWLHGSYLETYKALHWGGTVGLWDDSVSSLCSSLLYEADYSLSARAIVKLFLRISCGLILLALAAAIFRRKQPVTFFTLLTSSFAMTLLFILVLHYWRGTLFPLGRTGLFLVPVFLLSLILALDTAGKRLRPPAIVYASVFCVALIVHLLLNMNVHQTMEWYYEADSKIVVQDLHQLDPEGKQTLYCDWLLNGTMDYYRTRTTFMHAGPGSNGVPDISNNWALIDVWRHGYPDSTAWKVHRTYSNNLVLFSRSRK